MIAIHPENLDRYQDEMFLLCYMQTVCRIKRECELVWPVRLIGHNYVKGRLWLFFEGRRDYCFAVEFNTIKKLTPVVSEVKQ